MTASPSPTTPPPVAGSTAGPPSPAALELARTFAREVAGEIDARAPTPGDYAMGLRLSSSFFITTELRIDEHREGAMRLTLGSEGSARACLGVRTTHVSSGQYHYEPEGKRQHRETTEARLLALAGSWASIEGVARVVLDRMAWSTCDPAKTKKQPSAFLELRCTGVARTARFPADGLACEAAEGGVFGLGTPMSESLLETGSASREASPAGPHVLFGRGGGLEVQVAHQRGEGHPKFELRATNVALDEDRFTAPTR